MSSEISATEWLLAKEKFNNQATPRNGELFYIANGQKKTGSYIPKNQLNHSFIMFSNAIPYAKLNEIAGKGAYGVVEYTQSEGGSRYALKIQHEPQIKGYQYNKDYEQEVLKDVGLLIANGRDIDRNNLKKYYLMPDLGIELSDYLRSSVSKIKRLDIAIKLCLEVANLHNGITTESGRKVVHRDIKPANIMINTSSDSVRLADYGLSIFGDPESKARNLAGTPYYLPYQIATKYSNQQLDNLALKRCIYMPSYLYINQHGLVKVARSISGLLDRQTLSLYNLDKYFDSSSTRVTDHSALEQGSLLIIASCRSNHYYQQVKRNTLLQKALFFLYFAGKANKYELTNLMQNTNKINKLASIFFYIKKIPNPFISTAYTNTNILNLLIDIKDMTRSKQNRAISQLKSISIASLGIEDNLNKFRLGIGLSENVIETEPKPDFKSPISKQKQVPFFKQNYNQNNEYKLKVNAQENQQQRPQKASAQDILKILLIKFSELKNNIAKDDMISARYLSVQKATYTDPRATREKLDQKQLLNNIIMSEKLDNVIYLLKNRFLKHNSTYSMRFNNKLIDILKNTIISFNKISIPTNQNLAIRKIFSWLEGIKDEPIKDIAYRYI